MGRLSAAASAASLSFLFAIGNSGAAQAGPFDGVDWGADGVSMGLGEFEPPAVGRAQSRHMEPPGIECPAIVENLSRGFSRSIAGGRGEVSIDIEGLEKLKIEGIGINFLFVLDNDLTLADHPPASIGGPGICR